MNNKKTSKNNNNKNHLRTTTKKHLRITTTKKHLRTTKKTKHLKAEQKGKKSKPKQRAENKHSQQKKNKLITPTEQSPLTQPSHHISQLVCKVSQPVFASTSTHLILQTWHHLKPPNLSFIPISSPRPKRTSRPFRPGPGRKRPWKPISPARIIWNSVSAVHPPLEPRGLSPVGRRLLATPPTPLPASPAASSKAPSTRTL